MTTEVEKLKAEIDALSPPEKLRLAADLLEAQKPELAYRILDRVSTELGAALALRELRRAEGPLSGRVESLARALMDVASECERADAEHGRYRSAHEAYGVLAEEVAEFFDEVRKRRSKRDRAAMRKELSQVAAVAIRAMAALDTGEIR